MKIKIPEAEVKAAARKGMAEFVQLFADRLLQSVNGTLDSEALTLLNAEQITLVGYAFLRKEVLEGGFVQLIYNGYGPLYFRNPYAKAVRQMGLERLASILYDVRRIYDERGEDLGRECSDEEFMALYENFAELDPYDDAFVDEEEDFTAAMARYIDDHIDHFAEIV